MPPVFFHLQQFHLVSWLLRLDIFEEPNVTCFVGWSTIRICLFACLDSRLDQASIWSLCTFIWIYSKDNINQKYWTCSVVLWLVLLLETNCIWYGRHSKMKKCISVYETDFSHIGRYIWAIESKEVPYSVRVEWRVWMLYSFVAETMSGLQVLVFKWQSPLKWFKDP